MKLKRGWKVQLMEDIHGMSIAGGGHVRSHGDRAAVILKGANYSTLFAYLWRRFGPPIHGWDDHKELVSYYLTTPVPGIGFGLSCSPCGLKYGVSYAISQKWVRRIEQWERGAMWRWYRGLNQHCINDGWATWNEPYSDMLLHELVMFYEGSKWGGDIVRKASPCWQVRVRRLIKEYLDRAGECPRVRHIKESVDGMRFDSPPTPLADLPRSPHRTILTAIEAGLSDLLRPVNVRDMYINATGKLDDDDVGFGRAVRPTPRAGKGCSPDLTDADDDWWDLAKIIRKQGVKSVLKKIK